MPDVSVAPSDEQREVTRAGAGCPDLLPRHRPASGDRCRKRLALPRSEPASGSESSWHQVSSPRRTSGR